METQNFDYIVVGLGEESEVHLLDGGLGSELEFMDRDLGVRGSGFRGLGCRVEWRQGRTAKSVTVRFRVYTPAHTLAAHTLATLTP